VKKLRDDKGGVSQELGEASFQAAEGTTIDYYFDGDYVIIEAEGVSMMAYYTQGQGLMSQRQGSSSYFYHYDGLGSTKALTDASQNTQASYNYDAWGSILQTNGTIINPYLYVGELGYYADGDSGMYLLTQRWYNPVVGRFVARDPIRGNFSYSYIYAENRPLIEVDPSGLICLHIGGGCIGNDCHGRPECPPSDETKKTWASNFKEVVHWLVWSVEEGLKVDPRWWERVFPYVFAIDVGKVPGNLDKVKEDCTDFLNEIVRTIRNGEELCGLAPQCMECCKSIAAAVLAKGDYLWCNAGCADLLLKPRSR